MLAKNAFAQNTRFKIGWILLLVMAVLMTLNHLVLIFILDEPSLFLGFTLFTLYALLVLLVPFRRGETWAWFASWLLPIGLALPASSDANIAPFYYATAALCALGLFLTMQIFPSWRVTKNQFPKQ